MQTDMHYYGTYVMARAAGLSAAVAQVIATAAEYVDDSDYVALALNDGVLLEALATAHHPVNVENLEEIDQRKVWVPFHFFPGNEGETFEERLMCRMDGKLAQEMVAHHLAQNDLGFNLELMGVAAHVYADTFSHYGFSGISSDLNRVDPDSITLHVKNHSILDYIKGKFEAFSNKYLSGKAATAVALGHGSVSTYPDRPYLAWSFKYTTSGISSGERVNQQTFLVACQKLHEMFFTFAKAHPDSCDSISACNFSDIQNAVAQVLAVEGSMDARIEAWQNAVAAGNIYPNPNKESIPVYAKKFNEDIEIFRSHSFETIKSTDGYAFLAAAKFHRDYVIDELLPKYELHVLVT
ncbi:DUF6765 family protein [Sideroxydans lithotrophicus]|uniref:Putative signal peptide protein n=1 Tax=Sideroxydans lithotrophicus (strain ES-1) TaxID=580332 RepID=D5CS51_SIDLE|nr:DUF6765 family protein [Sideroxydans lithotrophicus]ADE11787.1 putative signal peptide protein [Sideroxydans lithotrophicus ES-1]